ncbi:MAG: adenosylcobalamin-dependent ribonucleoside-diphosphate reductase [Candidatus Shapirobacteria bacterium]|nr:adenosylcobalamin-dependent ribonucleoside-diphosphate reductase [Candidatus Shapirobacteria bacterium]MDD4410280.1 adenosylcobalamin-dependent ribonucleoside-diphosphate reductase [Candidatus Shapirobacteria bacterium]
MTDLSRQNINESELLEPSLSTNAKYIAETRYSRKDEDGKSLETVKDIFWRVASNVAKGDKNFGANDQQINDQAKSFYQLFAEQKFLPNTPCLVNAGKAKQQLSACFVLPIDDSMESILETMTNMALIHKSGGGTGFSFSRLRPSGDYIKSSGGTTVGPVSFMQAYNDVTAQIKQGGVRRGANMGMLSIDHPDVLRFAVAKLDEWSLTNFNISLAVTNAFMEKIEADKKFVADDSIPEEAVEEVRMAEQIRSADERLREVEMGVKKIYEWAKATQIGEGYDLINPRTGTASMKLNAYKVFNLITRLAWQFGDPGLVFIDRMNDSSSNPIPSIGRIEATNPCGEQPLLPYDACNLGSVNLSKFVEGNDINWNELKETIKIGVHFLDNVVEINEFPVQKIRDMVTSTRRIGVGVMGFADALFKLGVKYDSEDGIAWAEKIMKFVTESAREATSELGVTRGAFPLWDKSVYFNTGYKPRNMALTTIAPTGTISMLADTSSGIEPVFSLGYQKNTVEGKTLYSVSPVLVEELKKRNIYSEELIEKIVKNGGILKGIEEVPEDLKSLFITALEIDPEWHIRIQAAFQKYTDNAVSKTINLPEDATVDDVRKAYLKSYSLGTKGITIYRSGSRSFEPMQKVKTKEEKVEEKVVVLPPKKKVTPIMARGVRLKKKCDLGNVYTSIFYEAGDGPVEVFVNLGKSGGFMSGAAEATGRLASLALKYGASLGEIADEMVGIACGQKVGLGPGTVLSMFDAVGKSLLEVSRGEQLDIFACEKDTIDTKAIESIRVKQADLESKAISCPDCGSPLRAEEGCFKCTNEFCGYSKCS